ncbi:hypothetical protein AB670_02002 [Chryseobacterium sp. MOF25P]|uniref:hypothetical protein n=1 Tax=unclassified Chryseobacterium TaxID=2593645 RepID=UPI000805849A|nr:MULTISPECIES: hypothetical protein [unclassified Chryseobacterium]OBW41623.1 hypothetical protein AB670_02002 [Chryseobacterium sp. MOF25P]OBW47442.1 hypothetical protein AB671_00428 [Chryseobacterium sp. BGARF1]
MKNLKKLEIFELENEKLKVVVGGNDPVTTTGGGSVTIADHLSPGQSTTTTWTSDVCNPDGSTRYLGKVTKINQSLD